MLVPLSGILWDFARKQRFEELAGVAVRVGGDLFRCADGDDFPAAAAAFRTQVHNPVGGFDDVKIVFDDDDGVAAVAQAVQHVQQLPHVVEVQAGGRFVEDVEGAAGVAFGEFAREFDPLRFAAGEGHGVLSETDVAEAHVEQGLQFALQRRDVFEEMPGFLDVHVQYVADGFAFVGDTEGFAVVACAVADVAGDVYVRQEVHFDFDDAVALAGFASAAFDVEGEAPRRVAARAAFLGTGEKVADGGEDAGVGGGVGSGGAADGRLVDVDDFVELVEAGDAFVGRGVVAGAVEVFGGGFGERFVDEGAFAAAGDAGDAGEEAERQFEVDVFQVVAAGAIEVQQALVVARGARGGHGDGFAAGEVFAGEGIGVGADFGGGALRGDGAAVDTRTGADVHDVVGGTDGVFVVFDDDDGVAEVAQAQEAFEQAGVVALVQADGGFVKDVHDADQSRADLRGEADALCFAAGEGFGAAGEGEVVEADVVEESQAVADFFEDFGSDCPARAAEIEVVRPALCVGDGPAVDVGQGGAVDVNVAGGAVEAGAVAGGAFAVVEELADFVADVGFVGLAVAAVHGGDDAFEGSFAQAHRAARANARHGDFGVAAAVEDEVLDVFRQVFKGGVFEVEVVMRGECLHLRVEVGGTAIPASHRTGGNGEVGVHDDAGGVDKAVHAEAVAFGTGAVRVVEGEKARFQLAQGIAANGAGVFGGEGVRRAAVVHGNQLDDAVGETERGFQRFGEALRDAVAVDEAVNDDADVVFAPPVDGGQGVEVVGFAVDTRAHEALLADVLQQFAVFALPALHQRRNQHPAAFRREGEDAVHHLAHGLRVQLDAVFRAARNADAGEEQAQVVVDFGDGADGGTRVMRGGFLLDGDGGREAFDVIHIGLVHDGEKLARVSGKRFDVAPLSFGVDSVKGERGFAAAGKAGDDDKLVARQVKVDIFQIVSACAAYGDGVHVSSVWVKGNMINLARKCRYIADIQPYAYANFPLMQARHNAQRRHRPATLFNR